MSHRKYKNQRDNRKYIMNSKRVLVGEVRSPKERNLVVEQVESPGDVHSELETDEESFTDGRGSGCCERRSASVRHSLIGTTSSAGPSSNNNNNNKRYI